MRKQVEAESTRAARRLEKAIREMKEEYRELFYPLRRMTCKEAQWHMAIFNEEALCTDGLHIYYNPAHVASMDATVMKRQIAHLVFHGILGHFENGDVPGGLVIAGKRMMDQQVERMSCWFDIPKDSDSLWFTKEDASVWPSHEAYYGFCAVRDKKDIEALMMELGGAAKGDDHIMWNSLEDDGKRQEMARLWRRAREIFIAEIEGRLMDRMFRQHLRRIRSGLGAQELEEFLQGRGTAQLREYLEKADDICWWELTEYFCELLVDEAKEGAAVYGAVSEKVEHLFTILEMAMEREILQEKVFLFINGNEALLRAVCAARPDGYLKQCERWIAGMDAHQFV